MTGRKPLLTEEVINKLCTAKAAGAKDRLMCQYAGISEESFYLWKRMALEHPKPKKIYLQLLHRLSTAKAMLGIDCLKGIKEMGYKDWKAFKYLLQNLYPGEYLDADAAKIDVNNTNINDNGAHLPLTPEQRKSVEQELLNFLGDASA